jgi:hypothetical protein
VLCALCRDPTTLELLWALSFADAKRHLTKGLLQRIDLSAILHQADSGELAERTRELLAEQPGTGLAEAAGIEAEIERLVRHFESERHARA